MRPAPIDYPLYSAFRGQFTGVLSWEELDDCRKVVRSNAAAGLMLMQHLTELDKRGLLLAAVFRSSGTHQVSANGRLAPDFLRPKVGG